MKSNINAEVISIGTEILLGELTDTNSVFIAQQLRDLGINLYFMTSVGDNQKRIAEAVRIALSRAQVVITCGGLGPTVDDMTRQAVADATGQGLVFHQSLLDQIEERFRRFKVTMTENNRRQAYLPENATVIENPVGTAPSFIVEYQGGVVISLPGVPREMKYLMTEQVIPYLRGKYDLGVIKARTLKTAGIGESMLDDAIGDALLQMSNPTIGLAAHNGQVDVRITAKADTGELADAMIADMEQKVRERIGRYIYGADQDTLEVVLRDSLTAANLGIAICEAGLGAELASALEMQTVTSRVYVTPSELAQAMDLSATTMRDLSVQAATRLQTDTGAAVCIAVVSLPDVDESADVEEATAVTVLVGDKIRTRAYGFGGKAKLARQWISTWSLASAWWMVKEYVDGLANP
jgi:nicotinamide-nucleotide amidase